MKKVTFYIGNLKLGTYLLIDSDVKLTAKRNGIIYFNNIEINDITNSLVTKLAA